MDFAIHDELQLRSFARVLVRSFLELGIKYEDAEEYQKATNYFQKLLAIAEILRNKKVVRLAYSNLGRVYDRIGHYQQAIDCLRTQIEINEELGDKSQLRNVYGNMGHTYGQTGQYQLAIESFHKQLVLAEEQGSKREIGKAQANLGVVYRKAGQYQKSIECLLAQLEIAKDLEDKEEEARALMNLGNTFQDMGQFSKAYEYQQTHLTIFEQLGNKEDIGNAYGNMAMAYEGNAQYQKAIDYYQKMLEIFLEAGNKKGIGEAYSWLGRVHTSIGQYKNAMDCHQKHLKIAQELNDTLRLGRAYGEVGTVSDKMGQHNVAIDYHRQHLEIAERLGDKRQTGAAYGNMGNAYYMTGQYDEAMECHRKSLEIAQESGNKNDECTALSRLGSDYHGIKEYQKAVDYKLKSLEIAEAVNDKSRVELVCGNMGNSYSNMSRYHKATECYRKQLDIAQDLGCKKGEERAYVGFGTAYTNTGQYKKAIECFSKHLEICQKLGNKGGVGKNYANMGLIYSIHGQYQKAIDNHFKSLEIATELGDKVQVGRNLASIGCLYCSTGEYQKAMENICESIAVANQAGDRSGVQTAYLSMGHVCLSTGQRDAASDSYRRSLKIAQEIGDDTSVANAQSGLGMCYVGDDDHLACSFFAKSILLRHNIRSPFTHNDEFNTSFSDKFADNYKFLFLSLLNLNQVKCALLVSDSGKAKALYDLTRRTADVVLDSVQEKNIISPVQAIVDDPSLKASEALFDVVLSKVINQMQDGSIISYTFSDDGRLHAWVISRAAVIHKQWQPVNDMSAKTYFTTVGNRLRDSLMESNPQNVNFLLDEYNDSLEDQITSPVVNERESRHLKSTFIQDLEKRVQHLTRNDAVREKREPDEHAIEYDSVKKRYNLDQPTSNHHGFGKKNDDDEDEEKLFGRYFLDRSRAIPRSPLHQGESKKTQQDTTIEPYLKKLYTILISPIEEYLVGSKLLVVPEGSLFHAPFCAFLNSKDEHLCDRFSLQFTPSLHVLESCLSRPLPKLGPALFVGNPTVGEVKFRDKVVHVTSLPNATMEARECGKYFNAEPLLEENAMKQNVLKRLKDASVIHIAAHGDMDHGDVFLAPNDGASKPPSEEHYLLTAKDIIDCTLKARLVVLSCCHSGRGQISAEGVVGIARSFLGAGARSVLVTLWQIRDKPTMEFMVLFYERVCQELSVCVALQQAMLELKKKYHAMQVWAPFQIVGEDVVLTPNDIEEIRRQSRAG